MLLRQLLPHILVEMEHLGTASCGELDGIIRPQDLLGDLGDEMRRKGMYGSPAVVFLADVPAGFVDFGFELFFGEGTEFVDLSDVDLFFADVPFDFGVVAWGVAADVTDRPVSVYFVVDEGRKLLPSKSEANVDVGRHIEQLRLERIDRLQQDRGVAPTALNKKVLQFEVDKVFVVPEDPRVRI